ncbi:MAG: hypothetical protein HY889_00335 [Deltaproteobacteria bacterium]|nr:hypothetical protein [Deltaproteobacteria bacterium]
MKKIHTVILLPLLLTLFLAADSPAASQFRQDYIKALDQNNFTALEYYGRTGKKELPVEVRALLKEAREAEVFDDRMHLMDIAASMAGMYRHWHGDANLLAEVEAFMNEEIKKENARIAEFEKWNRYETLPGNLVFRERMAQMEARGLSPVLFPHWVHRLNYECKACHQGLFTMKRGVNAITQANITEGRQCGACHNGTVSFSAKENCERCHRAGKPGDDTLLIPEKYDLKKIKETAARVGSAWNPEKLKDGKFPLDRLGFIDWSAMKDNGVYTPLKAIEKGYREELRDNTIYYEPKMTFIKGVLFSHKTHSTRAECASCHQDLFKDTLGGNPATMMDMSTGASCGACHGKTAFKLADCNRCHTVTQGAPVEGALKRTPPPAGK